MTLQLRTKDNLDELLNKGNSPAWVIADYRVAEISQVEIYQFDGRRVLKADFDAANSIRNEGDRLIVAFSNGKIEDCDFNWNGQNPVKYVDSKNLFYKNITIDELDKMVESVFNSRDKFQVKKLMSDLIDHINEYPHNYWFSESVYSQANKLKNVYLESLNKEMSDDERDKNINEIEDFISEFYFNTEKINFDYYEKFNLYYNKNRPDPDWFESPADYKWSKIKGENETSFAELMLNELNFSTDKYDYYILVNAANSYLWTSLQTFTKKNTYDDAFTDHIELTKCIWSVFDYNAHEIETFLDLNFGQEAVDNIIKYILRIDKEEFNVEENPNGRDDLETYADFNYDYLKIGEIILGMDIFDL